MKFIKVKRNNKIEAAEQPTTPKPTTTLPNNMTWAWDPKANQWIAVMKDNPVVTPPTYNPNNVNNLNNTTTTTQMYTPIKSSYFGIDLLVKALEKEKEIFGDSNEYRPQIIIFITNPEQTEIIDTKLINKETASSYPIKDNEFFLYMDRDTGWKLNDYSLHPTSELKRYYGNDEEQKEWYKEWREKNSSIDKQKALEIGAITEEELDYLNKSNFLKKHDEKAQKILNKYTKKMNEYEQKQKNIKSSLIDSLNQFLDGDKYSREIKLEKGLISGGLIKLAGINPIKGPKYSITDKGLQLLKQAAQEEYDFENDYVKARKSYLLDGITESEFQTGAPQSQGQMPKFSIFEKDGSELAQIQAKNETDAKVKFFMENPEYEGSQTISVKKVNAKEYGLKEKENINYKGYRINIFKNLEDDYSQFVIYAPNNKTVNHEKMYKGYASNVEDALNRAKKIIDSENGKEIDSTYCETTNENLSYPNQSVSPSTDVKVDPKGWVNMAGLKIKAVKLTPKLLQLGNILDPYIKNGSAGLSIEDENKGNISVRGDAETINIIESKVRDLGIFCNNETLPADEGKGIYTLNIFLEE